MNERVAVRQASIQHAFRIFIQYNYYCRVYDDTKAKTISIKHFNEIKLHFNLDFVGIRFDARKFLFADNFS